MELYKIFLQHPVICTDSRVCPENSIFFALKGDNFNANAFALSAIENGCAYAVVDDEKYAIDHRFILVKNVLATLQELATYHRKKLLTPVIGITGTNGKTTTKELIAAVLKEKYNILFTQGNFNNHIGVPLTLLQLKTEHELAIIEMGANHIGEIKELAEIACPDYGIITNVGKAHLEGFGSFEGVKQTKSELYDFIFKNGKEIFINKDNEFLMEMASKVGFKDSKRTNGFSLQQRDDNVYGRVTNCSPFLEMLCSIKNKGEFNIKTQLIGSYNAENILAAVSIGAFFDVDTDKIKKGLENYTPQNNRSQLTITKKNKLVVDAYNANPTSLRAAIINFAEMEVPNKTLIIGDMLELGEYSEIEHQNIIDLIQHYDIKNVLLVGKEFLKTKNNFTSFIDVTELIKHIELNPISNHYILIKGSRGIKLEKIISSL